DGGAGSRLGVTGSRRAVGCEPRPAPGNRPQAQRATDNGGAEIHRAAAVRRNGGRGGMGRRRSAKQPAFERAENERQRPHAGGSPVGDPSGRAAPSAKKQTHLKQEDWLRRSPGFSRPSEPEHLKAALTPRPFP